MADMMTDTKPSPSAPALGYTSRCSGNKMILTVVTAQRCPGVVYALAAATFAVLAEAGWTPEIGVGVTISHESVHVEAPNAGVRDRIRRALAERNLAGRLAAVYHAMVGA